MADRYAHISKNYFGRGNSTSFCKSGHNLLVRAAPIIDFTDIPDSLNLVTNIDRYLTPISICLCIKVSAKLQMQDALYFKTNIKVITLCLTFK